MRASREIAACKSEERTRRTLHDDDGMSRASRSGTR